MDEIEEIRRRKMRQMEQKIKQRQLEEEQQERERSEVDRILAQVLMPDAAAYLKTGALCGLNSIYPFLKSVRSYNLRIKILCGFNVVMIA